MPTSILVMGGSRGSVWINNAIKPLIQFLCQKFKNVYHVTGYSDFDRFKKIKVKNYHCFNRVDHDKMLDLINSSDVIISRAGANTVWELVALKKPAILIPIPWSYLDEQTQNAKYMVDLGIAEILPQKTLNSDSLRKAILKLVKNYDKIIRKSVNIKSDDLNASQKITEVIGEYL